MLYGFIAVASFLVGSIVALSLMQKDILKLKVILDLHTEKLDCIAEWLIDQDQDPDELDLAGIDDPNSTDLLVEMFLTEVDRASLLEEDSCNE